jgi:uncharacterized protein with ATP-grasp and redox domains
MSCLIKQVERAIRLLQPNAQDSLIVETQYRLMKHITSKDPSLLRSEDMGTITYTLIAEVIGKQDPYIELKEKYNNIALDLYPQILDKVFKSRDPLRSAIIVSILGNSIDFGSPIPIDIEVFSNLSKITLEENHQYERLISLLEKANSILILGDNAGEIVFDKILVKILTEKYPNKTITYSVRGGPIINDATMKDAIRIGMPRECKVITSSQSPGVIVEQSSEQFQQIFLGADVILSKGQGNFESIISTSTPTQAVFFLLKAKCELISKIFQVPVETLVLREKTTPLVSTIK